MKRIIVGLTAIALLLGHALPAAAELPSLYRRVASVHWVVRDLDRTLAGWTRLGVPVRDLGEVQMSGFRSGATRARMALGRIAEAEVVWIQPLGGENAFTESLARHGEGVFSVNYDAGSPEALESEVKRLSGLGVRVLQRGQVLQRELPRQIVHMDTEAGGKYVLGLVAGGAGDAVATAPGGKLPFPAKLSQYALVVKDLQAVSDYWAKLGFPAMEVTHGTLTDLRYHGAPGRFDQKLGWHRQGTVTWEWIQPLQGPTVYEDFLGAHGEGFHHFALDVPDMDTACAALEKLGAPIVQSGG